MSRIALLSAHYIHPYNDVSSRGSSLLLCGMPET